MNQYIIEQKITAFVNRYMIFDVRSDGLKGNLIAFVEQKRLALKEEIIFYADETKSEVTMSVKAEKVMDVHGKFLVTDKDGALLGAVRKSFKSSLLRSTWEMLGSDDSVQLIVREKSLGLALFRRTWSFLPYLGDIPFFIKYHFDFIVPNTDTVVAKYVKTTRFRDHYQLQIVDQDVEGSIGWQTIVAQCVLLDALQAR